MSRIDQVFAQARREGRKLLVPYITAGDPDPGQTVALMQALVAGGADLIELGVPFSDPMADGPVIQRACERALAHGTQLIQVLEMVRSFRRQDSKTPVVLMGYLNPIEAMGEDEFVRRAKAADVDGILTVDLPVEEAADFSARLKAAGLDRIFLLAPTTEPDRLDAIAKLASGYLYYVSLKGVTGANTLDVAQVRERLAAIRKHTDIPLAVGFGIRDASTARQVGAIADAVVVGSSLVAEIERCAGTPQGLMQALQDKVAVLRAAIDSIE